MGLDWDSDIVFQSANYERHREIAEELVSRGKAYRCYFPVEDLQALREEAKSKQEAFHFRSPWRDESSDSRHRDGRPCVIRLKTPLEGQTSIDDTLQGHVTWRNAELDDLVLLRSDGTPTYMLAVVADDHDMGVSHIIRGDDHLTNTAKQTLIYHALDWEPPAFSHIPLIHDANGRKMSKRENAPGIFDYRKDGYLKEGISNFLTRLGWSHGDDEIFSQEQAIAWFCLGNLGVSPARFDSAKLLHVNACHLRNTNDDDLLKKLDDHCSFKNYPLFTGLKRDLLMRALPELKTRVKTLEELYEITYYIRANLPLTIDNDARALLTPEALEHITALVGILEKDTCWTIENLENQSRKIAESIGIKLGTIAQPLRAKLTGRKVSPSVFSVMHLLGKEETIKRLRS
jgi:glutamyl-tRNA synthetase